MVPEIEELKKPSWGRVVGVVLVIVLFMSAAFVGGRLLQAQISPTTVGLEGPVMIAGGGPGGAMAFPAGASQVQMRLEDAPELPDTTPDVVGLVSHQSDNSVFVGTGDIMFGMMVGEDGSVQTVNPTPNGPTLEVVIGPNTKIYRDTTEMQLPSNPQDMPAEGTVYQTVELEETLGTVPANAMVRVWGEKTGDRLLADIFVYAVPLGQ